MTDTRWNGEPCTARRITAIVTDTGVFPQYWARHLVGTRRNIVEVTYGGETSYIDDEDGSGWHKVTNGGSPHWAHSSITIDPASIQPRDEDPTDADRPGPHEDFTACVQAVVRVADGLTTQVRRIADALETPAVEQQTTADDDTRHATIAAALTAEHYRRAEHQIVASPEEHCATMASAVMRVLPAAARAVVRAATADQADYALAPTPVGDDATMPSTTCSAPGPWGDAHVCWLPADHDGDHEAHDGCEWTSKQTNEAPAADEDACRSVDVDGEPVLVRGSGDFTEQDAKFFGEIVAASKRRYAAEHTQATDEGERCITHVHGACDGTTRDCAFPSPGTRRRRRLRLLLNQLVNTLALTADEALDLTRHVALEISEANTARARAERAEHERDVMAADLETADRIRAEAQRDRDQHAAILAEVLREFTMQTGDPDDPRVRTPWLPANTVERWRSVVAPTVERPWWQQLAEVRAELKEAQAAIERVRATTAHMRSVTRTWEPAADLVDAALDGTGQQEVDRG